MARKGGAQAGKKHSYEEKGKRKADSTPSDPPSTRRRRSSGIHINENANPMSNPHNPMQGNTVGSRHRSRQAAAMSHSTKTAATSSKVSNFRHPSDEDTYVGKFSHRIFTKGKKVDFLFFGKEMFGFVHWLKEYGLFDFLKKDFSIYSDLVKHFYFNLSLDGSTYTSFLRGIEVSFTEQEFAGFMLLPIHATGSYEDIDFEEIIFYFTQNESLSQQQCNFTNKEFSKLDYKLLHLVVAHCFLPKGGGYDIVTLDDLELMWAIVKNKPYNIASVMLSYMLSQKRRANGSLPYAMYLTRLFQHFNIDLTREAPIKPTSYDVINESTLKRMRYTHISDGEWVMTSDIHAAGHQSPPQQQRVSVQIDDQDIGLGQRQDGQDGYLGDDGSYGHQGGSSKDAKSENEPVPPSPFHDSAIAEVNSSTQKLEDSPHISPPNPTPEVGTASSKPGCAHQSSAGIPPQPYSVNVDFSSLQSFLESNFQQLNSRMETIETKLDTLTHNFHEFKHETVTSFSHTQESITTVASTIATATPIVRNSISTMMQQLEFAIGSLCEDSKQLGNTMRDLRDNTDRICLTAGLPELNDLLQEIANNNRRRAMGLPPDPPSRSHPPGKEPYEFQVLPHFRRSKPS